MSFKVHIASAARTINVPPGTTILDAALDAGVSYPFGCQSGNCGACKSHLVKGEVTMTGYSEFALSDEEKAFNRFVGESHCIWRQDTLTGDAEVETARNYHTLPAAQ